ncbi:DUF3168 domain-containing protein [Acinetobacter sp. ANC 7200]|uniref:DUF3168 domain-containing protein n=1 Tax=Acinetobacter amyesii TaxID=2942470 RepID=UPI0020C0855E|nr:DUF3168 domain-containing protein [Acinetobacter amyesii]MCL6245217.1 DUF3168 domain-containing protein [Acinetobacter amyesii]
MTAPIAKTIKANTELFAAFGDRVYLSEAPLDVQTPYLVFQGIGSEPENTIDCGAIDENDTYQMVIWHSNPKEAEDLRLKARIALEQAGFYYNGKHPDTIDPETRRHGRGWDMNWWSEI